MPKTLNKNNNLNLNMNTNAIAKAIIVSSLWLATAASLFAPEEINGACIPMFIAACIFTSKLFSGEK